MTAEETEYWIERAAIAEFHGGLSRVEAEKVADECLARARFLGEFDE